MGYTKTVIKGISWMTGIRIAIRILTFVKTIVIARILNPAQFGVFGIATLVLTFVEIITETGINIFLVQKKDNIDKYVDTAWITSITRGFIIGAIIFATSSGITRFFSISEINTIALISIVPIIRGFINPSIIKQQKELLFKREFYYRTVIFIFETAMSIIFVIITNSVSGLIYAMILSAAFEAILSFFVIKPTPKLDFHILRFKEIIHQGKWITGSTVFNYFYQSGDNIAVGKLLGTGSLGLYDMAYKISLAPLSDFADTIAKVTFPVYVKISNNKDRLRRAFLKTFFFVFIIVVPIGLAISLFAKDIIILVLGEKWIGAIPALQILGIFGAIRAISVFSNTFFLSIKKQNIFMYINLVGLSVMAVLLIPLTINLGIFGAGLSALIGTLSTLPVIIFFIYKFFYYEK